MHLHRVLTPVRSPAIHVTPDLSSNMVTLFYPFTKETS